VNRAEISTLLAGLFVCATGCTPLQNTLPEEGDGSVPASGARDGGPGQQISGGADGRATTSDVPMSDPPSMSCMPDEHQCASQCFKNNDPRSCGACDHDCTSLANVKPASVQCQVGKCVVPADGCVPGHGHCSTNPDDLCETDLTAVANCGNCGNKCPATAPFCSSVGGTQSCVLNCSGTTPDKCGTACLDLKTDVANCGACGNSCLVMNGTATCTNGTCGPVTCSPGWGNCDTTAGCETQLNTTMNCGKCGTVCPPATDQCHLASTCPATGTGQCSPQAAAPSTTACTTAAHASVARCDGLGACKPITCSNGFANCSTANNDGDGCETNLSNDVRNCGRCGNPCASGQNCISGQCACPTSGQTACLNGCFDLSSNSNNCGMCGHACGAGTSCSAGQCRRPDGAVCTTNADCISAICGGRCCPPFTACRCPQPTATNLVQNPGFDTGITGWSKDPGGTSVLSWQSGTIVDNNGVPSDADSCPFSGAAVLTSTTTFERVGQCVQISPATLYNPGIRAHTADPSVVVLTCGVDLFANAGCTGTITFSAWATTYSDNPWSPDLGSVSALTETPFDSATNRSARIWCTVGGNGTILLDEAYIAPAPNRY
jgi:hypothetical protein